MQDLLNQIESPKQLLNHIEILKSKKSFIHHQGVYAWYFRKPPGKCPTDGCVRVKTGIPFFSTRWHMLYVGYTASLNLYDQIVKSHFQRTHDSPMSTLRMSLACLFGLSLVKCDGLMDLSPKNNAYLTKWMIDHTRVVLKVTRRDEAKPVGIKLIQELNPPLNFEDGSSNPFAFRLKAFREKAIRKAIYE